MGPWEIYRSIAFETRLVWSCSLKAGSRGLINTECGSVERETSETVLETLSCVSMGTIIEEIFSDGVIKNTENRKQL